MTGGLGNFSDLKFFTQFFCDRKKFHKFFPAEIFCPKIFARENFRAESPDFWSVNLD